MDFECTSKFLFCKIYLLYSLKYLVMTKKEIGKALIKARGKKTRYQVCKEAKVAAHQLTYMEKGANNYTLDSLIKVCKVVGLEVVVEPDL